MTKDEISQRLVLLPEGLAEENIQSWQRIVKFFELMTSPPGTSRWTPMLDLVQSLSESEQAKLFRAGASLLTLMISTKEKHGLENGDAYIYISSKDEDTAEIGYRASHTQMAETYDCKNDELITESQLLLDRLWNETRGKKKA